MIERTILRALNILAWCVMGPVVLAAMIWAGEHDARHSQMEDEG